MEKLLNMQIYKQVLVPLQGCIIYSTPKKEKRG